MIATAVWERLHQMQCVSQFITMSGFYVETTPVQTASSTMNMVGIDLLWGVHATKGPLLQVLYSEVHQDLYCSVL